MTTSPATQLPRRPTSAGLGGVAIAAALTLVPATVVFVPLLLAATGAISLLAMLAIQWGVLTALVALRGRMQRR